MEEFRFNLIEELNHYQPFDITEAKNLQLTKDFIKSNKNLFSRSNSVGHINGSGFLLSKDLSQILLTHHKALNKWLQFGGHSDGDENTMRVAMRETFEESGIKNFKPLRVNGSYIVDVAVNDIPSNEKKKEPAHKHYDIYFMFTTPQKEFVISEESNDLKWFTFEEFKQLEPTPNRLRFIKKWENLRSKEITNGNEK